MKKFFALIVVAVILPLQCFAQDAEATIGKMVDLTGKRIAEPSS